MSLEVLRLKQPVKHKRSVDYDRVFNWSGEVDRYEIPFASEEKFGWLSDPLWDHKVSVSRSCAVYRKQIKDGQWIRNMNFETIYLLRPSSQESIFLTVEDLTDGGVWVFGLLGYLSEE